MADRRRSPSPNAKADPGKRAEDKTSELFPPQRSYHAPALEKGLDILELLAERKQPLALHEMTRALGRSSGELFRMVHTLRSRGYIETALDGDGYVLTDRLFSFALTRPPTRLLIDVAQPFMRKLADCTMQSVHISVATGKEIMVLTQVEAPGDLTYSVRVGHHKPLGDSTSGLVLFAFQAPEVRATWLTHHGLDQKGKDTETFLARAEQVRRIGFASAPSSIMEGVTDISAAIEGANGVVAALTIPYVQRKSPVCSDKETVAALVDAAKSISDRLQAQA